MAVFAPTKLSSHDLCLACLEYDYRQEVALMDINVVFNWTVNNRIVSSFFDRPVLWLNQMVCASSLTIKVLFLLSSYVCGNNSELILFLLT